MILTTSMLKEKYRDYANPLDKIKRETENNNLYRLTRGVYETDSHAEPISLAAVILSPSYISFEFALSFYGLIPERVFAITSASLQVKKKKTFNNHFGRFEYSDVPLEVFPLGITMIEHQGRYIKIATKEKAICDSLYKSRVVTSVKELKILLFEDKRIDEEEFASCDFSLLLELASHYHKKNHENLIKLIRKEYLHE